MAVALPGCMGGDDGKAPAGANSRIGAPLRLADCRDWNEATLAQRRGTVDDLRDFAGGPAGSAPGGRGATLDPQDAYRLFENFCKRPYARGFKLYKLYTRAAAFSQRR